MFLIRGVADKQAQFVDALEFVNNTLEAREEEVSDREPRLLGRIEEEVDVFNQLFVAVVDDVVRHGDILLFTYSKTNNYFIHCGGFDFLTEPLFIQTVVSAVRNRTYRNLCKMNGIDYRKRDCCADTRYWKFILHCGCDAKFSTDLGMPRQLVLDSNHRVQIGSGNCYIRAPQ